VSVTIVTTSPAFGKIGKVPEAIAQRDWQLVRCIDASVPDGGVRQYVDEMEILVVGLIAATAAIIDGAPRLKVILKHGVGVDNIDIASATSRGIPVINAPGTNANAVAELATGMMFSLARRIPMVHKAVISGGWMRHVGSELKGKILGIVGLGNIGKSLALKARALGMEVMASELYPDREFAAANRIRLVSLEEVLAQADFVSLHVFGGKENENLIGARELGLMKQSAYIMNFARGEILDLDALATALDRNQLLGAAIDAYVVEPPDRNHPIFSRPNVIFTPHSGADTTESVERMGLMNVADIDLVLAGETSPRVLNPEVYG
jgi:D-3-phosphoglycerate dehydrogenase / 2-oxoglutarate reductase